MTRRDASLACAPRAWALLALPVAALAGVAWTSPNVASAQRCIAAGDRADDAAGRRHCGTDLVGGLGGPAGFGDHTMAGAGCLSQNDDGSSPRIDISSYFPGGLNFFGTMHTSLFVNTNGNITFSDRLSTFTPAAFPVAARPMIAPYWADVDIRGADGSCTESIGTTCTSCTPCYPGTQNGVWWHFQPGRAIFTWDEVGYYNCGNDRRMSFQLILSEAPGCGGAGDFDVEFRFNRCEWETGGASGGSGGFGGTPAQSGFDAGNSRDFVEIMGSRTGGIAARLCDMSNVGDPGVWQFQIRSGVIMCPEAGMPCDTGREGVCGEGRISCDCSGASCTTMCVPQVAEGAERCNALDDDCDGSTDEGMMICPGREVCDMGVCVAGCFEGGCDPGFTCTSAGICVESTCVDVMCADGQRCVGGSCVGACDGVTCPAGLSCRGGRCVDACDGIMCDDCTVCEEGSCITRCDRGGGSCAAGETCAADGSCEESACVGVSCGAGTFCRGGACVDACDGAVCPMGQICELGMCIPRPIPDAGPPGVFDAGPRPDGGTVTPMDGGTIVPGEPDASRVQRMTPRRDGCSCRAAGTESRTAPAGLLLIAMALAFVARRRR